MEENEMAVHLLIGALWNESKNYHTEDSKIEVMSKCVEDILKLSSKSSVSQHRELLEAFTKHLCEDDFFELQDWDRLIEKYLASNCG